MSSLTKIGVISKANGKVDFEWKIDNFFSYTEDNARYFSPDFHALNLIWRMEICPNGSIIEKSVGYVSLFLYRVDYGAPESVDFSFGIKTKKHLTVNAHKISDPWESNRSGLGWPKIIAKSELKNEEENLVPSGILTVICSLALKDQEQNWDRNENKNILAADFKNMFVSKKSTDVIIKVQENFFSVHRFVLEARSPVLAAMFENDMIEKKTGFIDITDCDPEAFHHFLLYLYSGEIEFESSEKCNSFYLYKIGDKYDVPQIKLMCINSIIHNISLENFCETYLFGHQFNEQKLLTVVQNFFSANFEKVVSSDSWVSMMKEKTLLANNLLKSIASKVKIEK